MAYNRNQARALTNDSEYELFAASLADAIGSLTPAQLRGKITRARNLRDKNSDLFRRQSLAVRETSGSKRGKTGAANQRTEQKAKLFDETLKRFEARLEKLSAAPAPAAAKKSVARPTAASRKTSARKAATAAVASVAAGAVTTKPAAKKPATAAKGTRGKGTTEPAGRGASGAAPKSTVRGKVKAAHTRASTARSQAKRDKR